MLPILFGLLSALSWGGGDFAGGVASRRVGAFRAVLYAEGLGLIFLFIALGIFREELISSRSLTLAACAGGIGSLGLILLYLSMATGKMSIAAPVSALLAAALPIIVGIFTEGWPKLAQLIGFGLALTSIWLVSQPEGTEKAHIEHLADLRLPLLAGLAFGTYFILIHNAAQDGTIWPMVASRSGGTLLMAVMVLARREKLMIPRTSWWLLTLSGALDVGGNAFYILASQLGRLDIAAVLASLYPGMTALLAWIILKERIRLEQRFGILLALGAIALMTV